MDAKPIANDRLSLGDLLYADRSEVTTEEEWAELVRAIASGDQQALRALYDRSHRIVFTLAMRICGNRQMTEELTVDVFHDVWRRASEYDPANGPVMGWLMMQTRSRSIDRLRFEQRKKRVAPAGEPEATTPEPPERHDRESLEAALDVLTSDERQAIETAFFSDLTYAETATQLDAPLGTIKTRIRTALGKLRKALDSEGSR